MPSGGFDSTSANAGGVTVAAAIGQSSYSSNQGDEHAEDYLEEFNEPGVPAASRM
jgi:hypothetical protein